MHHSQEIIVPVEIKASPNRPNTSRGVITVEAGDSNETILQWLRCEQADILAVQRIGKTNRAVLTFDSPTLPRVVKYYMAIVRVSPYAPKRMVCFNCHNIGHMAKYCPKQPVCRNCGRTHNQEEPCERTLFCVACKEDGHLALDPKCASRKAIPRQHTQRVQDGVSWADCVRGQSKSAPESGMQSQTVKSDATSAATSINEAILAQLDSLRSELRQLREENAQLKEEIATLRQGTPHQSQLQRKTDSSKLPPKSAQRMRPNISTTQRRSRSASNKRTPTSQQHPKESTDFMQILKFIRADLQQERRERQTDIERLRTLSDSYASETKAMLQLITSKLPGLPNEVEPPPRKVAPRNALTQ